MLFLLTNTRTRYTYSIIFNMIRCIMSNNLKRLVMTYASYGKIEPYKCRTHNIIFTAFINVCAIGGCIPLKWCTYVGIDFFGQNTDLFGWQLREQLVDVELVVLAQVLSVQLGRCGRHGRGLFGWRLYREQTIKFSLLNTVKIQKSKNYGKPSCVLDTEKNETKNVDARRTLRTQPANRRRQRSRSVHYCCRWGPHPVVKNQYGRLSDLTAAAGLDAENPATGRTDCIKIM